MRLAVLAVLISGCGLYFDDNHKHVCNGPYGAGGVYSEVRDPDTGMCVPSGQPQYPECSADCPCPPGVEGGTTSGGAAAADPNWPACDGKCEGLGETACLATAGCHADYQAGGDKQAFWQCTEAGVQPQSTGACENLDATSCQGHDNCVSSYAIPPGGGLSFKACAPEPGTVDLCAGWGCDNGHCEVQCPVCAAGPNSPGCPPCHAMCVPDQTCTPTTCPAGSTCVEQCAPDAGGNIGVCSVSCVPNPDPGPGSCNGPLTCTADAVPSCPSGTTPGIANGCYTGYCIPWGACSQGDPGACTGTVTCDWTGPSCAPGTTRGIANGCYTGFCIPDDKCPAPTCEALTTESACTARGDCEAVYVGSDCTCSSNGQCTCAHEAYDHCRTLATE